MAGDYRVIKYEELLKKVGELFGVELSKLYDVQKYIDDIARSDDFTYCPEWESYEDIEVYQRYVKSEKFSSGSNIIITDEAYHYEIGPFEVDGRELADFIEYYFERFKACLFTGCDVFIINLEQRAVFYFHHSYYYANIQLPFKTEEEREVKDD